VEFDLFGGLVGLAAPPFCVVVVDSTEETTLNPFLWKRGTWCMKGRTSTSLGIWSHIL
jgi:hypothetical protein